VAAVVLLIPFSSSSVRSQPTKLPGGRRDSDEQSDEALRDRANTSRESHRADRVLMSFTT